MGLLVSLKGKRNPGSDKETPGRARIPPARWENDTSLFWFFPGGRGPCCLRANEQVTPAARELSVRCENSRHCHFVLYFFARVLT